MAENNEKKIELEEGEIMRISIRCVDSEEGKYETSFVSNGKAGAMVEGLMRILDEEFDLMCVPKGAVMGIGICVCSPSDSDEEDEECEENAQEESQE